MKSPIRYLVWFAACSSVSFTLPFQSHAQSACADHVLYVCDLAEQSSDGDPGAAMTGEQTHQLYAALTTPESEQTCRDAFDATKQMYRQMTPLYASQGIVVPGICR